MKGALYMSQEEQLLDLYLSLTADRRSEQFVDTGRAAEITGMARRTVQMWAGLGAVRAVKIGGKYQIDLDALRSYLRDRATNWLDG
jgi:excisionase family DNA binding protein